MILQKNTTLHRIMLCMLIVFTHAWYEFEDSRGRIGDEIQENSITKAVIQFVNERIHNPGFERITIYRTFPRKPREEAGNITSVGLQVRGTRTDGQQWNTRELSISQMQPHLRNQRASVQWTFKTFDAPAAAPVRTSPAAAPVRTSPSDWWGCLQGTCLAFLASPAAAPRPAVSPALDGAKTRIVINGEAHYLWKNFRENDFEALREFPWHTKCSNRADIYDLENNELFVGVVTRESEWYGNFEYNFTGSGGVNTSIAGGHE